MTAEVAILNKTAVALAADSAITYGSSKIYNSGNKLFTLSKYQPLGIMIYGNAEFMGVPWETIIKSYREYLFHKRYAKLTDYADHFLNFLENEASVFWPKEIQEAYFRDIAYAYFNKIKEFIDNEVTRNLQNGKLSVDEIRNIIDKVVKENFDGWDNSDDLFDGCNYHLNYILSQYRDILEIALGDVFQQLPISTGSREYLFRILGLVFCKKRFNESNSGVVIAGFGEDEIYPSFIEYGFEAITAGKLKYIQKQYLDVSRNRRTIISAFAQREMVDTFIQGVDPSFRDFINSYFTKLLNEYPRNLLDFIPELSSNRKKELLAKVQKVSVDAFKEYNSNVSDYANQTHVNPVLEAVYALPKDELAAMAESLVNMTSFKRRVSMQAETVGGPIDVAVISKGDGFVWIKRKHYFKPELNPGFINNYFRDEIIEKDGHDQYEDFKCTSIKKNRNI
jgi:hypothetical protein